ncbi:MAG: glycosyltransferase family 2 protein [bacterium]|uniref:Glycosyltransferase family 2 protein n=1 Tax=Candidatus Aphodosoma intestinipullorum TaxID=2840674 RepID=A0A940DJF9_9BACT|nr:glycosyltransferase family 2 protein [Candidatus Aphodosoma intestinipullorum]
MIDILLSTYNGEKYLAEQLDSLFRQSFQDFRVIVRDDCSSDNTVSILRHYSVIYPDKIEIIYGDKNIGYIKSFEYLLSISTADYAMFCDQDDIWLPDKIEASFDKLLEYEKKYGRNTPILIHTDLTVTDENLNSIHSSFIAYSGFNVTLLESDIRFLGLCNTVTGCTALFNRALINQALPFHPGLYHDAWMAVCAKKYGCLAFLPRQTILYRQHGDNALGALDGRFSLKNKLLSLRSTVGRMADIYRAMHGIVYKNPFHFIYFKTIYTVRYRMFKQ